jgi:hypothetical protein
MKYGSLYQKSLIQIKLLERCWNMIRLLKKRQQTLRLFDLPTFEETTCFRFAFTDAAAKGSSRVQR